MNDALTAHWHDSPGLAPTSPDLSDEEFLAAILDDAGGSDLLE